MADTFVLEIATPERLLIRADVREAQVPASNGYLGIMPGHSPLLAELGAGELSFVMPNGTRKYLAVDGGWTEVLPDRVRVLATHAEKADEIDAERAQEALNRATERLAHPDANLDVARALNAMKRAQARLSAAAHK
jgi:F-type H+-transporting ATPase subunit epsilon